MVDETTEISNKEQAILCFRWVSDYLIAHEECFGLYGIENTEAQTLVNIILDVLTRLNLSIKKLRGQCYDGGSSMRTSFWGSQEKKRFGKQSCLYTLLWSLVEFSMHGYYKEFQSYARSPRYYRRDN